MTTATIAARAKPTFDGYLAIDPRLAERFAAGDFAPTRSVGAANASTDPLSPDPPYQRHGAVAVVEIMGPLLQYGGWWYDGHEAIQSRCFAAMADAGIKILALRIDSPGGQAAGCFDAVRAVRARAAEAGITVVAWCGGDGAYSAGYAWACAASSIALPDTGGVGSVGVLSTLIDRTQMTAGIGYRIVVVRSGSKKAEGHPDVPLTDGAIAREQAVVDGFAAIFAKDVVGPARKMSAADVLSFEGECVYGQSAVGAGFADQVMPWEDFLAQCEAQAKEIIMKGIMGRLGLAADASEQRGIEAIDAIEARVAAAEKASDAKVKASEGELAQVADRLGALLCEDAVRDGKITTAQVASKIEAAKNHRNGIAAGLEWLDKDLASTAAMSALPRESTENADPTKKSGDALEGKTGAELAKVYESLANTQRAALAESDPKKFAAMRAAWRASKGQRSDAATT